MKKSLPFVAGIAIAALLGGCATAQPKPGDQPRDDDAQCRNYGADPAGANYAKCRAQLDAQHRTADAAAASAPPQAPEPSTKPGATPPVKPGA
ncbi:MAG TPA: hypothetical protein VMU59_11015 [Caulobacteraceae bacterium]|nr:hypothetical protein [Caulobacteraceae bacterium]